MTLIVKGQEPEVKRREKSSAPMRIVQTFWSGGKSLLQDGFGWLHPEYNLMSWALSCLSLREHYDEVALYTDSEGKRILIDKLHLPYTEVNVIFDDFPCLPQHWALAKIKTYSIQTRPFLHVDGDVTFHIPFLMKSIRHHSWHRTGR